MPQVLEKTLRRQVQRVPQLRCRYWPGCFITASGTCVHSSGCHHGKRAEVQKIPVRFCECFSESGFRHLPHTTEVFLDFRDFLHQSRFCEAFSRRHHPLSTDGSQEDCEEV